VVTRGESFSRRLCMHCLQRTCVSVCPGGGATEDGARSGDLREDRCIGVPLLYGGLSFQVPVYEWSKTLPKVKKCNMCYERVTVGSQPPARKHAPRTPRSRVSATNWSGGAPPADGGSQEVRRAHLRAPRCGGTSVFYLSAIPLEQFGIHANLPQEPLPELTGRGWPSFRTSWEQAALCWRGIYWITHRREEVAAAEGPTARRQEEEQCLTSAAAAVHFLARRLRGGDAGRALRPRTCAFSRAGRGDQPERPVSPGPVDRPSIFSAASASRRADSPCSHGTRVPHPEVRARLCGRPS